VVLAGVLIWSDADIAGRQGLQRDAATVGVLQYAVLQGLHGLATDQFDLHGRLGPLPVESVALDERIVAQFGPLHAISDQGQLAPARGIDAGLG
jgi:hypothetical protein